MVAGCAAEPDARRSRPSGPSSDYNRDQDVLNIQPVIPAHISKDWMLITRIIQPIVWQPYPNQNTGGEYGLGDMNPTFFLSPAKPGKVIWGWARRS
jgi:hypothetical protein